MNAIKCDFPQHHHWFVAPELWSEAQEFRAVPVGVNDLALEYWHDGLMRYVLIDTGYASLSDAYYASQRWLTRRGVMIDE